jgi:cytochrome c-type biogenesis protein CcmH
LWIHSRRRAQEAAGQDSALLSLTADEEARLDRLLAAEPAPEK